MIMHEKLRRRKSLQFIIVTLRPARGIEGRLRLETVRNLSKERRGRGRRRSRANFQAENLLSTQV